MRFALSGLVVLLTTTAGMASETFAQNAAAPERVRSGLLWRTDSRTPVSSFTVDELARKLAPVLWFSPDEPLVLDNKLVPSNLPGDAAVSTVYYAIRDVHYSRSSVCRSNPACRWSTAPSSGDDAITNFHSAVIRFFFFYPADVGFGGHRNDLESLEVEVRRRGAIVIDRQGRRDEEAIWVERVAGSAHGLGWYTNELVLKSDQRDEEDILVREDDFLVLPLHVLVEEGKHASAPDRNGDGVYSPGFDVTQSPRDAWGIRDTMAGRYLPGNTFSAQMAKRRLPDSQHRMAMGTAVGRHEYVLVAARHSKACNGTTPTDSLDGNLRRYMKKLGFCETPDLETRPCLAGGLETRPYGRCLELINLSYRTEGGSDQFAAALGITRVRGLDGWLAARASFAGRGGVEDAGRQRQGFGIDLLYMPSTSRIADWYAAIGVEGWTNAAGEDRQWKTAVEAGWKLRFPLPEFLRMPIPFAGMRGGIRFTSLETMRNARLVLELGLGAW